MLKLRQYEVVGIFNSIEELNQTVDELFIHGFDQSTLSVLANEESVRQQLKRNYKKIDELADNENVLRAAFYAEENFTIAQGTALGILIFIGVTTAAAMVIIKGISPFFASTIVGITVIASILVAQTIGKYHKRYIEQQLKKGGLLLWVRLRDKVLKDKVIWILKNNHARNVHLRYTHKHSNQSKNK